MSSPLQRAKGPAIALLLIAGSIAAYFSVKKGMKIYSPSTVPALSQSEQNAINQSRSQLTAKLAVSTPQMIQEGKKLYASKCASCHGSTGQGGNAPNLRQPGFSPLRIATTIYNGAGNRMPAFSRTMTED